MASKIGVKLQQHQQIRSICRHRGLTLRNSSSSCTARPNTSNDNTDVKSTNVGARKLFQQTPVHPSILEHIRSIGVGIVPRDTSGRNNKKRFSYKYIKGNNSNSNVYDDTRSIRKSRPLQQERQQQQKEANQHNNFNSTSSGIDWTWMPPAPFGPRSLPVRMIGNVGPDAVFAANEIQQTTTTDSSIATESASAISSTKINMNAFPKNLSQIPEIAVMGRSNVGKSTLLNALLYGNRDSANVIRSQHKQRCQVPNNMKLPKGIKAVMSNRPGETKHISFYKLQHMKDLEPMETTTNDGGDDDARQRVVQKSQLGQENRSLLLVDLPGYGFAYAKENDAIAYRTLMYQYLLHRGKTLQRVLLLIDARHGMKKADLDFLTMLEEQHIESVQSSSDKSTSRKNYTLPFPIQIVLTKCDLVSQSDLARRVTQVRQQLSDMIRREPGQLPVMLVSARPGVGFNNVDPKNHVARGGILELQKELAALAQPRIMENKNIEKNKTILGKNI